MNGNVSVVIGSWGSYNECNERSLGSKWLDLSDYSDWDEVVEELIKEGFELNSIDEELFIQDVEGIPDSSINWDYVNPETLFNTLKESGVLDDDYKYETFTAYLEIESFKEFESLVDSYGSSWDMNISYFTIELIQVTYVSALLCFYQCVKIEIKHRNRYTFSICYIDGKRFSVVK